MVGVSYILIIDYSFDCAANYFFAPSDNQHSNTKLIREKLPIESTILLPFFFFPSPSTFHIIGINFWRLLLILSFFLSWHTLNLVRVCCLYFIFDSNPCVLASKYLFFIFDLNSRGHNGGVIFIFSCMINRWCFGLPTRQVAFNYCTWKKKRNLSNQFCN